MRNTHKCVKMILNSLQFGSGRHQPIDCNSTSIKRMRIALEKNQVAHLETSIQEFRASVTLNFALDGDFILIAAIVSFLAALLHFRYEYRSRRDKCNDTVNVVVVVLQVIWLTTLTIFLISSINSNERGWYLLMIGLGIFAIIILMAEHILSWRTGLGKILRLSSSEVVYQI